MHNIILAALWLGSEVVVWRGYERYVLLLYIGKRNEKTQQKKFFFSGRAQFTGLQC